MSGAGDVYGGIEIRPGGWPMRGEYFELTCTACGKRNRVMRAPWIALADAASRSMGVELLSSGMLREPERRAVVTIAARAGITCGCYSTDERKVS